MLEIFKSIAEYPLEWLAGLGISTATIFTIIRLLGWFISLITKKSRKAKEEMQEQKMYNLMMDSEFSVIRRLANDEYFINKLAVAIMKYSKPSNDCPLEVLAYIKAVLAQNGSEGLALTYEQFMSQLLNKLKHKPAEVEVEIPVESIVKDMTSYDDKPKVIKSNKKPNNKERRTSAAQKAVTNEKINGLSLE